MSAVYYTKESLSKKGGSYRLIYGLSRLEFGLPLREMTSKEAQEGGHIKIFRLIAKLTISCGVNILWYTGRAKLEANYHRVHIVCFEMYIFESSYGFLVYFKVVPVVPLSPGNFKCLFTFLPDVRRNDILIKGRCYLVGLVVSIFFCRSRGPWARFSGRASKFCIGFFFRRLEICGVSPSYLGEKVRR